MYLNIDKVSKEEFHFTIQYFFIIMGKVQIQCAFTMCKTLNLKQENVQKGVNWYMMSRRPANDVIDDTTLPL